MYHFNEMAALNVSVLPSQLMIADVFISGICSSFNVIKLVKIKFSEFTEKPEMDPWHQSLNVGKEYTV